MTEDEETFYHRKLSSKKAIEKDGGKEKCKNEKSTVPSLETVGFDIEYKQSLNKSPG